MLVSISSNVNYCILIRLFDFFQFIYGKFVFFHSNLHFISLILLAHIVYIYTLVFKEIKDKCAS